MKRRSSNNNRIKFNIIDYGPEPLVVDIDKVTKQNPYYRAALWTGKYLQVTLMSIVVGGDVGLEMHPETDQFIRIEEGYAFVEMGSSKDKLNYQRKVDSNYAIMIPAGTWHNITNTGNIPLKLYSIYAPPHHPHGIIEETKPVE